MNPLRAARAAGTAALASAGSHPARLTILRLLSLALVGLAVVLAVAGPLFAGCVEDACSDDRIGRLGNEQVLYDLTPGTTYVELCTVEQPADCITTDGPVSAVLVAGTRLVSRADTVHVRARACNADNPAAGAACSDWSNAAEFVPYACLRTTRCYPDPRYVDQTRCDSCEQPCYVGAFYRLPTVPRCAP